LIQQLAAAPHKGQALLVLVAPGRFAYKKYFGVGVAAAKYNVRACAAQIALFALRAGLLQCLKGHTNPSFSAWV
jgi:hypothetical protein